MFEVYSTTLELWFGEYMYIDDEEWEDIDRVLFVERKSEPAPWIVIKKSPLNKGASRKPHVDYVYNHETAKFVKHES